jgi:signal transduction histidine kinase
MTLIKTTYYLVAFLIAILSSCKSEKYGQPVTIALRDNFESQSIHLNVLYSTKARYSDFKRPGLKPYVRKTFRKNENGKIVFFGTSFEQPEGWLYFEIANPSPKEKKLIFSTTHMRCDALNVYTLKGDSLQLAGGIKLQMPLEKRAYPLFDFAIPFTVSANDTTAILVKSDRFAGFHEIAPVISTERAFLEDAITGNLKILIRSTLCLLLMLIMLTLGFLFKQRLMINYSLFLFSMALVFTIGNGYLDVFHYPENIALSPSNVMQMTIFFCNALVHPFCLSMLRNVPGYEKKFETITWILAGLNVSAGSLFLIPAVPFFNQLATYGMITMTMVNMIWILYISWISFYKGRIYSFFVVALLSFSPTLINALLSFFHFDADKLKLDDNYLNSLFIILLISYLTIDQFKNELMSKRNHEKNIQDVKKAMDDLRKSEIEHIGRNLHDQVGNTLASALGYLNMKAPMVDMSRKLIFDGINEIRFLSHNLVRNEDIVLTGKLESLISRFNDFSSIIFQYKDYSSGRINRISRLKQENIFMIVQEILTNIIKHSKATEAYIQIFGESDSFEISIEDDGIGIDHQHKNKGMGLMIMQKRANLAHLRLTIDSGRKGTNIIIDTKSDD